MEDTRSVSGWLGGQEILSSTILTSDDVVEKLDQVTLADIDRVVRTVLRGEDLHLAVVGPHRSDRRFLPHFKL
jgi:predicted Zn-dependent peptidase